MSLRMFISALAIAAMFAGLGDAKKITKSKSKDSSSGNTPACLSVNMEPTSNVPVIVDWCNDVLKPDWTITNDNIKMKDFCLDISGSDIVSNTQLELHECSGNDTQKWKKKDGMIATSDGKFCIDDEWSRVAGQAVIWECNSTDPSQKWDIN